MLTAGLAVPLNTTAGRNEESTRGGMGSRKGTDQSTETQEKANRADVADQAQLDCPIEEAI